MQIRANLALAFALVCISGMLVSCTNQAQHPTTEQLSIRLERGVCFGNCVAYILTISADGRVTYAPAEQETRGERSGHGRLTAHEIDRLKAEIEKSQFFSVGEPNCQFIIDDESPLSLDISYDGDNRNSYREGGCVLLPDDPTISLAAYIDGLTNSSQWTHPE